jgi:hypothetical protein
VVRRLGELKPGDCLVVPGGWTDETGGHAVTYIVEREDEDYAFVICNTGEGLAYHPSSGLVLARFRLTCQADDFPKTKYKTSLRFSGIKEDKIISPAPWLMLLKMKNKPHASHKPSIVTRTS